MLKVKSVLTCLAVAATASVGMACTQTYRAAGVIPSALPAPPPPQGSAPPQASSKPDPTSTRTLAPGPAATVRPTTAPSSIPAAVRPPAPTAVAGSGPVSGFGAAMPIGDLPGWHQVFTDDFTGTRLDTSKWGAYRGQPGGSGSSWTGWWDSSHVEVHNGAAVLRTYRDSAFGNRWVSGGMSTSRSLNQEYGKFEVRFRVDNGYGINVVLCLWPTASHWPPEVDFAENGAPETTRSWMSATLHYGSSNQIIQRVAHADFSQWHTMGVEWKPGQLTYTMDGSPWATVASSNVPAEAMDFAVAAMAGKVGDRYAPAPNSSTPSEVDLQIDWMVAYAMR